MNHSRSILLALLVVTLLILDAAPLLAQATEDAASPCAQQLAPGRRRPVRRPEAPCSPPVLKIETSAEQVCPGEAITVTWSTSDPSARVCIEGIGSDLPASGQKVVEVSGPLLFTGRAATCAIGPEVNTAVTVGEVPSGILSSGATTCNGFLATLSVDLTGKAPWTIVWSDGFTQTALTTPATRNVTPATTTTYSLTEVSDAACSGTSTGQAIVILSPAPSAAITAPTSVFASATDVVAAVPDAGSGSTYTWNVTGATVTSGLGTRSITLSAGVAGPIALSVTVTSGAGCIATGTREILVEEVPATTVSLSVTPTPVDLPVGQSQQLTATANLSNGTTLDVTAAATWTSSAPSAVSVSATGLATALTPGSATITAVYEAYSSSSDVTVPDNNLPPDPALIAPPIDPTRITPPDEQFEFLYEGPTPVQTGVAPGAIDPARASVVRGRVLTADLEPLPGAKITVLGARQLGQTFSRTDGMYDLVVNGGSPLTIVVTKDGFLAVHRQVETGWHDFYVAEDAILTPLSAAVTRIQLNASTDYQVMTGPTSVDSSGSRTPRLLVSPGTTATMTLPGGGVQALSELHVRATEFTVGPNGPLAMPASLPAQSAYTYCVELSGDEAIASGATRVDFTSPVRFYLDNFLGFDVGNAVPVGSYDRVRGVWNAEPDGLVIRVFPSSGGEATVDADGDGVGDDPTALDALGIDRAERLFLAANYPAGLTLWRAAMSHFTPFDHNWPFVLSGEDPQQPLPQGAYFVPNSACARGSIIVCENQALGEVLPVAGTPFALSYRSDRVRGRVSDYTLKVPLTGPAYPSDLKRVDLEIEIAGRTIRRSFSPAPNLEDTFVWDGLDAYRRRVQGSRPVTVRVGYVYDDVYALAADGGSSFGRPSGSATVIAARGERARWQETRTRLGVWDALGLGLGGWSLDAHQVFDPEARTMYLGGGDRLSALSAGDTIETYVGTGARGYSGDGGPAWGATITGPTDLAVDGKGNLYIADNGNGAIRKVDSNGVISTVLNGITNPTCVAVDPEGRLYYGVWERIFRVEADSTSTPIAGTGNPGTSGDGGPAIDATFREISSIAFSNDGALYVNDKSAQRIRRIDPSGIIHTAAGTGSSGYSGDGLPATQSRLDYPEKIALDASGNLFVAVPNPTVVRAITRDGFLRTVAGNPSLWDEVDGVAATESAIGYPMGLAVTPTGELLIGTEWYNKIRRVDTRGIITTIAGTGASAYSGDGGNPRSAELADPTAIAVDPLGNIYLAGGDNRVRRIRPALKGLAVGETAIPSRDGSVLYIFDAATHHVRTVDSTTGVTLLTFGYSAAGHLMSIRDFDGNVTTIERDEVGVPLAIRAPFGQRTTLTNDAAGYLRQLTGPANEAHALTYSPGGLLETYVDPRGGLHEFAYDAEGKLRRDDDAADGSTTLSRAELSSGFEVTLESALGRRVTHSVQPTPTGDETRTATDPAGLVTTTERGGDQSRTVTTPDGTVTEEILGPDPRFGMQSPILSSYSLTTPGGKQFVLSESATVTLADQDDPLSLTSATRSVSINGNVFTSTFDASTQRVTTTSPRARRTFMSLDSLNRVSSFEVPGITQARFTYTPRGQLQSVAQGSRLTNYTYNSDGLVESIRDSLNQTVSFTYDPAGRVTRQTQPGGEVVDFAYDAHGNLTSLTPPGRSSHIFAYTSRDQAESYEPPALASGSTDTIYSYDVDRKLTRIVRPDGAAIDFGYDSAFRLASIAHDTAALTYRYDGAGRPAGVDRAGQSLDYTWDGPLLAQAAWSGEVNGSVGYNYGNDLEVVSTSVNGANTVSYTFDTDGLLTGIGAMTLTRDASNGLIAATQLGVVSEAYTRNEFGEVTSYTASVSGAPVYAVVYTRDEAGRINVKRETIQGVTTVYEYQYDTPGRLRDVLVDGVQTSHYEYDANGNRTLRITAAGTETASCDGQDRTISYGDATFTYTPNGELLTKTDSSGTTTFSYDAFGNLTKALLPSGGVKEYIIDGQNRRVGEKQNGAVTRGLLYNGQLSISAEFDASGTVVSRFDGGLLIRGGVTYRVLTDHLGSPRLVVNSTTGAVVQRMDFDEFGNVLADSNPGFQPFGFAGGLYDRDTGLTRFGARDYDSKTGRWTAKDPIGFSGGDTNLYGYVLGDPVNLVDPSGLYGLDEFVEDAANYSAGFGDTMTFGATNWIRDQIGGNEGIDRCSGAYAAGMYTEIGAEMALTGASFALRGTAKGITQAAARRGLSSTIQRGTRGVSELHHVNPLKTGLFSTAPLPQGIRHSPLNLKLLPIAEHRAAHRLLVQEERALSAFFNPATTAGRVGYGASGQCGCQ